MARPFKFANPSNCCCPDEECGSIGIGLQKCGTVNPVPNGVITIRDGGGTLIGSCITGAGGACAAPIPITAAGTYKISIEHPAYASLEFDLIATCSANTLVVDIDNVVVATIFGCSTTFTRPVAGALLTVTMTGSGNSYTGTVAPEPAAYWTHTASYPHAMHATAYVPESGAFTWTVQAARFATASGSGLKGTCGLGIGNVFLTPTASYKCPYWTNAGTTFDAQGYYSHAYPLPLTPLHWTEGSLGNAVLTYDATAVAWQTTSGAKKYKIANSGTTAPKMEVRDAGTNALLGSWTGSPPNNYPILWGGSPPPAFLMDFSAPGSPAWLSE